MILQCTVAVCVVDVIQRERTRCYIRGEERGGRNSKGGSGKETASLRIGEEVKNFFDVAILFMIRGW